MTDTDTPTPKLVVGRDELTADTPLAHLAFEKRVGWNNERQHQRIRYDTIHRLDRAGIETLGELALHTEEQVRAVDGVGPTVLEDLRYALQEIGAEFLPAEDDEPVTIDGPAIRVRIGGVVVAEGGDYCPPGVSIKTLVERALNTPEAQAFILELADGEARKIRRERADALRAKADKLTQAADALERGELPAAL